MKTKTKSTPETKEMIEQMITGKEGELLLQKTEVECLINRRDAMASAYSRELAMLNLEIDQEQRKQAALEETVRALRWVVE